MISHNIHANYVNIEKTYKKTLKQLDGENEQKKPTDSAKLHTKMKIMEWDWLNTEK